jgi:hypothetical protein
MGDRAVILATATRNPFTPPSADLTKAAEGQEIRKPRSVWGGRRFRRMPGAIFPKRDVTERGGPGGLGLLVC